MRERREPRQEVVRPSVQFYGVVKTFCDSSVCAGYARILRCLTMRYRKQEGGGGEGSEEAVVMGIGGTLREILQRVKL